MKRINKTCIEIRVWIFFISIFPLWHSTLADTVVGEKLEMKCGEHIIVLTCNHSPEIAKRQNTYPRICNDNTLTFVGEDGLQKILKTYTNGKHRDKTPIEAVCDEYIPMNRYFIRVWMNDTAWSYAILLSESGTELKPGNYPKFRTDYTKTITRSRIAVTEPHPWQRKQ